HRPDHRADPLHRAALLARLHLHRYDRRVADDARHPGQRDARHRVLRVPDGHRRRIARPRRDDVALPVPGPARRCPAPATEPESEDDRLMAAIVQRRPTHSTAFRLKKLRDQILFWFVISLFIIFACFPVYWMFVTTFKEVNDLYNLQNNPLLFHLPPTLDQVRYLFEKTNFSTWVTNTAEVGGAVVLVTVLICVPAAYALARVRFPGSG